MHDRSIAEFRLNIMCRAAATGVLVLCAHICAGTPAKDGPAKVANTVKEDALATVTLTAQAETRLGVETVAAEEKAVSNPLVIGGEIVAVPGQTATLTAPFSGSVSIVGKAGSPAGHSVTRGQRIGGLSLLPTEEDILTLSQRVKAYETELRVAHAKMDRVQKLLETQGASQRDFQAAQVELAQAQAAHDAAMTRLNLVRMCNDQQTNNVEQAGIALTSPLDGVLTKLFVASGQFVAAGAPLIEIVSQSPVWVRVPVFVGDLKGVERSKPAGVVLLGADTASAPLSAAPVQGPPHSDAASATSDIYYQLANEDGALCVGQKVMVSLLRRGTAESVVVPYAAVLYDMHGNTWVYVKVAPLTYARRRVAIRCVLEGMAVVERGLRSGEQVVTAAAAEIFGTEFGGGK